MPCAPWAGRQWTASALGAQRAGARQGHTVQTGPAPAPCLGQSPGTLPWPPGVQAATGFKGKCTLHRWVWGGAGWGWGRRPRRAAHPGDQEPLTSVLGLPSLPGEEGQGEPGALGGVGGIRFIRPASMHQRMKPLSLPQARASEPCAGLLGGYNGADQDTRVLQEPAGEASSNHTTQDHFSPLPGTER